MAAPWPTLGHYRGGSLTHPMLIICILYIRPEGHWEPHNKVGSPSPAECLAGFEPRTFLFWSQHHLLPIQIFQKKYIKALTNMKTKKVSIWKWWRHPCTWWKIYFEHWESVSICCRSRVSLNGYHSQCV